MMHLIGCRTPFLASLLRIVNTILHGTHIKNRGIYSRLPRQKRSNTGMSYIITFNIWFFVVVCYNTFGVSLERYGPVTQFQLHLYYIIVVR